MKSNNPISALFFNLQSRLHVKKWLFGFLLLVGLVQVTHHNHNNIPQGFQTSVTADTEQPEFCAEAASSLYDSPFHFPILPDPNSEEPENEEESKEKKDDDESHKSFAHLQTTASYSWCHAKCAYDCFKASIDNRTPVSLVILYHSWKAFLV